MILSCSGHCCPSNSYLMQSLLRTNSGHGSSEATGYFDTGWQQSFGGWVSNEKQKPIGKTNPLKHVSI